MKKINKVSEIIYSMLIENTGSHFLDSGGAYGRHHQRNSNKSITDFYNESFEKYNYQYGEIERTVSLFHYLNNFGLSIDDVCIGFNQLNEDAKDWDCEANVYGVSADAWEYLENYVDESLNKWSGVVSDIQIVRTFNTYNGDSDLSQIMKITFCFKFMAVVMLAEVIPMHAYSNTILMNVNICQNIKHKMKYWMK
jgi:hypothetical protein